MQQKENAFDIYEHVTNTIIAHLERGTIPWRKPWITTGPPRNLLTRHWYTGINHILLNTLPYEKPYYLTFKQVRAVAGRVKTGEKGHLIVFRKRFTEEDKNDATKTVIRYVLRYYYVFNVAQCDNIPPGILPRTEPLTKHSDSIQECEFVVEDYKTCPTIQFSEAGAYYAPDEDYINMPFRERFESQEKFYTTLFHEMMHSTGHGSRLNRKEITENPDFESDEYSIEELTAEIGACYLNSFCGIALATIEHNAAYIANWLTAFKNDKKFIITASSRAQRAMDYILNIDRSIAGPEMQPAENVGD